jgi:hypothetical protein
MLPYMLIQDSSVSLTVIKCGINHRKSIGAQLKNCGVGDWRDHAEMGDRARDDLSQPFQLSPVSSVLLRSLNTTQYAWCAV